MTTTPGATDSRARARWTAFNRSAFGPTATIYAHVLLAPIVGAGIGILLALSVSDVALAVGLALVAGVLPVLLASWPLHRRPTRATIELGLDQQRRTRALWRQIFGGNPPVGGAATRRWLDAQPAGMRPIAMLLLVGRLEEADRGFDEVPNEGGTPAEVFQLAVHRQTRRLLVGEPVDLDGLRERLAALPAMDRSFAREQLAMLEAQVAAADGRDPAAVMLAARADVPDIAWSCRAWALVGRSLVLAVLPVLLALVVRIALLPAGLFAPR
jgi:hypothetical protein